MISTLLVVIAIVAAGVFARALVELICRGIDNDLHGTRGRRLDRWT